MQTMTSLVAQNQFGTLIDASLRAPIAITRRGRPVAVVQAYEDYQRSLAMPSYNAAKYMSENFPLRGQSAGDAMRTHLAALSNQAGIDGLSEADVMRLLNEVD
jgi:prevent-host-death family protein